MDDYYENSDSSPESDKSSERDGMDQDTALLPRSFFPDEKNLKPGKVCKIKVESVMEDEVAVSYQKHDKDSDEKKKETDEEDDMPMMLRESKDGMMEEA